MESPWEHLVRLVVGLALAGAFFSCVVYVFARRLNLRPLESIPKFCEGRRGFFRLWFTCALGLTAVACVLEDDGEPFTGYWWNEALLKGDWIPILIGSPALGLGFKMWANRRQSW